MIMSFYFWQPFRNGFSVFYPFNKYKTYHWFSLSISFGYIGWCLIFALVQSTASGPVCMFRYADVASSWYKPRSATVESHNISISSFSRKLHTVLYSGHDNSHSHQQCVLFSTSFLALVILLNTLIKAIVSGKRWFHHGSYFHSPDD